MNQFSIDIENVTDFFDEASIRHVRHLKITRSNSTRWKEPLQNLEKWAHLLQLQKLEVSFEDFARGGFRHAGKFNAKLLWPLIKAIVEFRGRDALDTVEFFSEMYRFGLNGQAVQDLGSNLVERHTKNVRGELLKIWEDEASKEEIESK